jgi:inner membrane transporter RhtA
MNFAPPRARRGHVIVGAVIALSALASTAIGAAIAKTIFPVVGATGLAALRIALAAVLLLALVKPWRRPVPRAMRWPLFLYGLMLGFMNLLIYEAFARIPIGIAVAIEVTGPLAIALFGSRRPRDFLWLGCAVLGLALLIPRSGANALDPIGIAFAAASGLCWATYILTGKHISGALRRDAAAWGMALSALVIVPLNVSHASPALFTPMVLAIGLVVAVLSSALPAMLELQALHRLPASHFGLLASAAPAIGALSGFAIVGEKLTDKQWLAIGCIVLASAGSALNTQPRAVP